MILAAVTLLPGCVGLVADARGIAIGNAKAEYAAVRELVAADLKALPGDDLVSYVESGGIRVDYRLVGLSDDEIRLEIFGNGQRSSLLLAVSQEGSQGLLELLFVSNAETGGGITYSRSRVFGCVEVEVDVSSREVGAARMTPCPQPVVDVIGPADEVALV